MSWLFGRRSDDEEEENEDDDDYDSEEDDEEDYSSDDADEEDKDKEEERQEKIIESLDKEASESPETISDPKNEGSKDDVASQNGYTRSTSPLAEKTNPNMNEETPTPPGVAKIEEVDQPAENNADSITSTDDPREGALDTIEVGVEINAKKADNSEEAEEASNLVVHGGESTKQVAVTNGERKPEVDMLDDQQQESIGLEKQSVCPGEEERDASAKPAAKNVSADAIRVENGAENVDDAVDDKQQSKSIEEDEEKEDDKIDGNETGGTTNDDAGAEEEVEEVTSTHEKRSLLVLAAEHDRVDILKAILADDSEDRDVLLNSSIPPLHISIAYGSTNAVQCLLRMGADPSVRPDMKKIKEDAEAEGEEQLVDIPHMGRFDQLSAWELAFGKADQEDKVPKKKSSGWFGGSDGKKSNSIDIAPSKLEGVRHAFTAEGLRCIGSDEVNRLKQLIGSGMPSTIDIGGKNLYDWAVEMGALQCEELLRPAEADRSSKKDEAKDKASNSEVMEDDKQPAPNMETASTAVLDRSKPGTESLSQLANRIDELENLSKALSSCLDNLAEEVSVCHGLLLMGGGATALASHVRSLKTLKENKMAELNRLEEAWENSEDELAYWVKECGDPGGREISELMSTAIIPSADNDNTFNGPPDEEQAHRQQLKAQAALLENKIRKLRASITDLSEESTRDLEEVERRGLSGGIKLVRTLRDEIREIDFELNETRSAEALCRAKIALIQSKMGQGKKQSTISPGPTSGDVETAANAVAPTIVQPAAVEPGKASTTPLNTPTTTQEAGSGVEVDLKAEDAPFPAEVATEALRRPSDARASGQLNAIALKKQGSHGYFTVDLWKILLRIIGLGSTSRPREYQTSTSNVMIV